MIKGETQSVCEIIEEEQILDLTDPRTYCFNVSSKIADVCLPRSCPVAKKVFERKNIEDEKPETTRAHTTFIPVKQPYTTCIPIKDDESNPGGATSNVLDPEKKILEISVIGKSSSNRGSSMKPEGKTDTVIAKPNPKTTGATAGLHEKLDPKEIVDPLEKMVLSGAGVKTQGGIVSDVSGQIERETADLSKLMEFAEGPTAILAKFGNIGTAKKCLASIGAISQGGAIMCECCDCDPCVCGPQELIIDNIVAALKTIMNRGEIMHKLFAALGPGSMRALETIMSKEREDAAGWATGGGMSKDYLQSENEIMGGTTMVSGVPVGSTSKKTIFESWLRGDFDEMTSCHCLPGMCPCPGGHYVFKGKSMVNKEKRKKKKRIRKKVKKMGKDGKEYEEWDWVMPSESDGGGRLSETCVCPPTKHFLTPASSKTGVSGKFVNTDERIYWRDPVCTCPRLQRTLVIIKPECVKFTDVVLRALKSYGLNILAERKVQLSPEQASEIYAKYYGSSRFPNLIVSISQAPAIVLSVGGIDVVSIWNHIIGPDGSLPGEWFLPHWISKRFGYYGEIVDALHASKNHRDAERENRYFFPESYIDPLMKKESEVKDFITTNVNPTLLTGLTLLAKKKPMDPVIFLAEWLLTHNPFQPYFPINVSLVPA